MIDVYLEDAPHRLADFRRGLDQNDLALAHRAVHTLKSTAASLGALRFASFCGEVEAAARGPATPPRCAPSCRLLEARLAQVARRSWAEPGTAPPS